MIDQAVQPVQAIQSNPHQLFPSEIEDIQSQLHASICAEFTSLLRFVFQADETAIVGGDQGFYWNTEDDRERAAPDAYLIRNAGKAPRKSWKLWQERALFPNLSLSFFLEVWSEDNNLTERRRKLRQYQALGIQEFFELDSANGDLAGQRLVGGLYDSIEPNEHGGIFSAALNAEVRFENGLLRLYRDGKRILTAAEHAERAEKLASKLRDLGVNPDAI